MQHTVYERSTSDVVTEKRVARDILNMIELVCFSEEYRDYRVGYGSRGERDLIIQMIQNKYDVK